MTIFLACSTKTCIYKYSRLYFHFCKIDFYRQIKGMKFKDFHISLKSLTACCLPNWFHLHRWHNRSRRWIYKRGTLLESFPHLSKRTGSGTFHTWNTIVDYVIIPILKLTKLIKKLKMKLPAWFSYNEVLSVQGVLTFIIATPECTPRRSTFCIPH